MEVSKFVARPYLKCLKSIGEVQCELMGAHMKAGVLFILLLFSFTASVSASEPQDVSFHANKSWNAFRCAALAQKAEMDERSKRLYSIGYEDGKIVLEAVKSNALTPEDIRKGIPAIFLKIPTEPSLDFALGRIYAAAEYETIEGPFEMTDYSKYSEEIIEQARQSAKRSYDENLCGIIGEKGIQ